MTRLLVFTLALLLASPAIAKSDDDKADLQQDICTEDAAYWVLGGPQRDYHYERVVNLCQRYKKRFDAWPEKCCRLAQSQERDHNHLAQVQKESEARAKELAALPDDERIAACADFERQYRYRPAPCPSDGR